MKSLKSRLLNGYPNRKENPYLMQNLDNRPKSTPKETRFETRVPKALEKGQRGLLVTPPYTQNADGSHTGGYDLSSTTIRKFVLFWDKIDVPKNNFLDLSFNAAEISYLNSCDLLQETSVKVTGNTGYVMEAFAYTHKLAFDALDKANPAVWSLASHAKSNFFSDRETTEDAGIMIKLFDALLIPDGNIHLADVLEFKEKRRDELLALRHHLDDVYQKIISSPDKKLAEISEIERLDRVVSDYNLAVSERGFSLEKTTLQANFSLTKAIATGIATSAVGLPILAASATGLVAGLDVKISSGLKRNRASITPYQYIYSVNNEL